jgi:hypothetical protein
LNARPIAIAAIHLTGKERGNDPDDQGEIAYDTGGKRYWVNEKPRYEEETRDEHRPTEKLQFLLGRVVLYRPIDREARQECPNDAGQVEVSDGASHRSYSRVLRRPSSRRTVVWINGLISSRGT